MTEHFGKTVGLLARRLMVSTAIHTGEWQSQDTSKSAVHATYEIMDVPFRMTIPGTVEALALSMHGLANLDWAEEHFQERIGGRPVNPPPSHERWPWARHNGTHQKGDQFSHTYPERMWPKHAGDCHGPYAYAPESTGGIQTVDEHGQGDYSHVCHGKKGIRFMLGDLSDVVNLLVKNPLTRQAYLPIWFPEDTGAVHGERVPCTLGYHFMVRNGRLSCRYFMRSCDLIRHFADDVYLAARLTQWVCEQVNDRTNQGSYEANVIRDHLRLKPGDLIMHISSLHAFVGDHYRLSELAKR